MYVADAWGSMILAFEIARANVTSGIKSIVYELVRFGDAIDFAMQKMGAGKLGIGEGIKAWGDELDRVNKVQLANLRESLLKPLPSEGISAYFDEARKKISAARAELAKPGIDVTKLAPNAPSALAAAPKTAATKFAGVMQAGSNEANNAVLRSRYGSGGASKPADQTAKNTAKIAENTARLPEQIATALVRTIAGGGIKDAAMNFGNF